MKQFSQQAAMMALSLGVLTGQVLAPKMLAPKIDLPTDSPVSYRSVDFSSSRVTPLGGLFVVDLNAKLLLRNTAQRRIRGIALAVDVGTRVSVYTPSLNVGPGEDFTISIENPRVRRPISGNSNGLGVEVKLDGVLFDDLSFYGTDTQAQYKLTRWELEARRDRTYFKELLAKGGLESLRKEMLALASQDQRPGQGVQVVHGRATNQEVERDVQFAFVRIPDSPVEGVNGMARVSGNVARAPRFTFRNRSKRPVERLEIGWIVKDQQGREFYAASMPTDLKLAPNQVGEFRQDNALRFDPSVTIQSVRGYVAGVEFSGGGQWVTPREALNGSLRGLAPPSPEEQRLLQIYTRMGVDTLIEELKKY